MLTPVIIWSELLSFHDWTIAMSYWMVSLRKILNVCRCCKISVPDWFVLNPNLSMCHLCLINCIGCQSVKELCIRLCCMCTNLWKGSLLSTFNTALLLKGVLRVLWEHAPLAAPILLFLSRRNVLGIELSPWLLHGCGTFYLWVSRMPLVNSHSNQCSRIISFLDCLPLFSAFFMLS